MVRFTIELFAVICLLSAVAASCNSDKSDGTPTTTELADPRRAITGIIASLGANLYNENWVGKPCIIVNKTTTCPNGGNVIITGDFSCSTNSNGVQALNLNFTYNMTDCIEVRSGLTVTLNGKMTHTGSSTNISSVITSENISYKSVGSVKIDSKGVTSRSAVYKDFAESCEFAISSRLTETGETSKTTGTLCGETYSLSTMPKDDI